MEHLPKIKQEIVDRLPMATTEVSGEDAGEILTVKRTTVQTDGVESADTYETPVWNIKTFTEDSNGKKVSYRKGEFVRMQDSHTNEIFEGTVHTIRTNTIDLKISNASRDEYIMLYPSYSVRLDL